jgi:ATP-binding cassette subfamily B protein
VPAHPPFYDVSEGRILVDGHDVRSVTQRSLRAGIGIVQQDAFLFAGSIFDNIRYGKPDATENEVIRAAQKAEIYGDIMEMPDGFQTYVGSGACCCPAGRSSVSPSPGPF